MNMDWPSGARPAVKKTARAVLVVRVVFDDFSIGDGFSQLLDADASDDALIDRMLRKLELIVGDLSLYFGDRGHVRK